LVPKIEQLLQSPKRGLICLVLLGCALLFCVGNAYLAFENDPRVYFSEDNPDLIAFEQFEDIYKRDDSLFFVVQSKSGSILRPQGLTALAEITEKAWYIENAERVDSLINFMQVSSTGDELRIEELVTDPGFLTSENASQKIAKIKSYASKHPSISGRLLSKDTASAIVHVTMLEPTEGGDQFLRCYDEAAVLAKSIEDKFPDLVVGITGSYAIAKTFHIAGLQDGTTLFPLMFSVMFLITWFILRSFLATIVVNLVIALSAATALASFGWLGISLNSTTASAPIVILVIAVADSIHLFRGIQRFASNGASALEAVTLSLRKNFVPIFVTSVTTIFGFLSLGFSEIPPFRELGYLSAIGVAAAFFYSVFLLPLLTVCLGVKTGKHREYIGIVKVIDLVCFAAKNHYKTIIIGALILTAGAFYSISGLNIGDKNSDFFGMQFPFRQATEMQEKAFEAGHQIEFSLDSGEDSGVFNPAFLAEAERFQGWLSAYTHVTHTESILTVFKELRMHMNEGSSASYALPKSTEEAAQLLLLYETSLPQGRDLNLQLSSDRSKIRVSVTMDNVFTDKVVALTDDAHQWFEREGQHASLDAATGQSVLWAKLYKRNTIAMLKSILVAMASITLTLILVMRSFQLGLLSLIPNLSPIFFTFGVWGILSDKIGIVASAVVAMMLGIIVDDTVHVLVQYNNALRSGEKDPVATAIQRVGDSIITTSIILVCGFICLGFSGFQINAHTGILSAITVVSALLLDLIFLPALLYWSASLRKEIV